MSTLVGLVDRAAERWPDAECVIFGDDRATFAQFAARTRRAAGALAARGVGPGDTVGVLLSNGTQYLEALFGAMRLGAIGVPINGRFKAHELAYVVPHAEIKVLLSADEFGPLLAESALDWVGWDELLAGDALYAEAVSDPAMLMYTSGTTANPKGCRLSHRAFVATAHTFGTERFPSVAGDRVWDPLPLFHLAGILPFNACLTTGATYVGMTHFAPDEGLRLLEEERCTLAFAAFDLIWLAILRHPRFREADLSRLRLVNSLGVWERWRDMQARTPELTLISPYGCTEASGVLALSHPDDPLELRGRTAGRPFAGMEVRIAEPAGEICVRGVGLFDGYHKDPEATAAAVDADGWFHTGDRGALDAGGRLSYLGRLKDMLKVGGENVGAAEVEAFLVTHSAIAEVQVVSAPDARYGEVVCAFVQLLPGAELTEPELIAHCIGQIATYKVPRYVRFVEEWPMSGTKIQRFRLRDRIAAELAEAGITEAPRVPAPA
jgi:fatty-acyl-CoA synthase